MTDEHRFHWRRVPGTAALAVTNLIAALVLVDASAFNDATALVFVRTFGGPNIWGFWFATAGVLLTVAALSRRWWALNVGSVISLFAWSAVCVAVVAATVVGEASLSPVALALAWWMFAGQVAMLIAPLLFHGRP